MKKDSPIASLDFNAQTSILHVKIDPKASMDTESLQAHEEAIERMTGGQEYLALVDVSSLFTIDLSGISFAAQAETMKKRKASAYYSPPLANRINITLFRTKLKGGGVPTEIFSSKEEAVNWLESCKALDEKQDRPIQK